jgi:hypothetical protein
MSGSVHASVVHLVMMIDLTRRCPNQHCQTSTGWSSVFVNNTTMAAAVARWYFFQGGEERHVDGEFPNNPTCGY